MLKLHHLYLLHQGENECSYYLKTGQCKFGMTCKFHHPQPSGMSMPSPARPFYPTVQSSSIPSNDQYGGSLTNYRTGRPPLLPGSYPPGAYGPMMLPPGVVPIQGWSTYSVGYRRVLSTIMFEIDQTSRHYLIWTMHSADLDLLWVFIWWTLLSRTSMQKKNTVDWIVMTLAEPSIFSKPTSTKLGNYRCPINLIVGIDVLVAALTL